LIIYLLAPLIAGFFRDVDRRGPKIFWIEHHELLCTLAHQFIYDEKPRPFLRERAWFYGLKGKPYTRLDVHNAIHSFEEQMDETAVLAFRQSVWREGKSSSNEAIARSEWPQSFATNGVLEVRTEKYGIYVVLKRGADHEAGIMLLGYESDKNAIENDPAYSRGIFWKNRVYRYYRESKK